jgi:hypothetical protein
MAELAIPAVALGALYICSNKKKEGENKREGFSNLNQDLTAYPSMTALEPPINYPKLAPINPVANVKTYPNSNAATDKYFDQSLYEKRADNIPSESMHINSLTGKQVNQNDFKHNNMVPFFGARVRGRGADADLSETILDNMQGSGSQFVRKEETAPLFKPQDNIHWANGAPNMSEFYQSRVNPGMNMANVKPWEEQRVGPGLGKGYTTEGSNGFNSGMEDRNAWLPKTVNELRVATNPKETFSLSAHEGPALAPVKNIGIEGRVEKNLPDTFYLNNPDRWFTTTGLEKGETQRPEQEDRDTNRMTTTCSYVGDPSGHNGEYVTSEYTDPKRPQLPPNPASIAYAPQHNAAAKVDFGAESYNILPNNRNTTETGFMGYLGGTVSAVMAPIIDILRPTRKENVIGNLRPTGDVGSLVPANYVNNPADRAPTTIKETTEQGNGHLYLTGPAEGGYLSSKNQPVYNQRDTTNCIAMGDVGGGANNYGDRSYYSAYQQTANPSKTELLKTHANQGGTQMFNQRDNIHIDKVDKDRVNNRQFAPSAIQQATPTANTYGKFNAPQYYNECQGCDRIAPDILDAFKKNPYTHSLHSAV